MISPERLDQFLEQGTTLIFWLGWILVALGGFKVILYLLGEIYPACWAKIKSPGLKKVLTGKGNRLIFGLGGLLTVLFGVGSIGIAKFLRYLHGLI